MDLSQSYPRRFSVWFLIRPFDLKVGYEKDWGKLRKKRWVSQLMLRDQIRTLSAIKPKQNGSHKKRAYKGRLKKAREPEKNISNGERRGKDGDTQHSRGRMLRLMNGRNGDGRASKLSPSIKGEGVQDKILVPNSTLDLGYVGKNFLIGK